MMVRILAAIISLIAIALIVAIGFRTHKNYQKKVNRINVFAVQNARNHMNLRPLGARLEDGTRIVLYKHAKWECMTWEFIKLEDGSFLLRNLFTEKSIQSSAEPGPGVSLWQKPLGGRQYQGLVLENLADNVCLLRLKGSDLYLTSTSDEINSSVILSLKDGSDLQQWRLVAQRPTI